MATSFLPATVPALSVSLPSLQPHGGIATFLHTVWINRTKNALWRTAQSRSNSSTVPLRCLFTANIHISFYSGACAYRINVVLMFEKYFSFSTTSWLTEAIEFRNVKMTKSQNVELKVLGLNCTVCLVKRNVSGKEEGALWCVYNCEYQT